MAKTWLFFRIANAAGTIETYEREYDRAWILPDDFPMAVYVRGREVDVVVERSKLFLSDDEDTTRIDIYLVPITDQGDVYEEIRDPDSAWRRTE